MNKLKVLLPFVIIHVIVIFLIHVLRGLKNQNKVAKQYDERQLLIQGKAYKYAFFTLLTYFIGIGVLNVVVEREYESFYWNCLSCRNYPDCKETDG